MSILKIVIDTCILKLATFPTSNNNSALILSLVLKKIVECWVSPAILDEYQHVLSDEPEFLAELSCAIDICYPLTELNIIRHEPDNRFVECAFAVNADYLITVNTGRGHFDKKYYDNVQTITPGAFVNAERIKPLIRFIEKP